MDNFQKNAFDVSTTDLLNLKIETITSTDQRKKAKNKNKKKKQSKNKVIRNTSL